MQEAASSRRAKSKLGDFSFSICAAVLGLALLFAAGRHLFVPSPGNGLSQTATVGAGQMGIGAGTVAVAVPATVGVPATVTVPRARTVAAPAARHRRVAPVTNVRRASQPRQASHVSRASHGGVKLQRSAHAADSSKRIVGLRRSAPISHAAGPAALARFAPIVRPVARSAPIVHARFAVHARLASGAKTRAFAPVRPRGIRPANVRPHSDPRRANRNVVARATSAISNRALVRTSRAAKRARATRQRAVIEPPLGYEAQPALVLAPAAVALDLGIPVIPSIRSRRHH